METLRELQALKLDAESRILAIEARTCRDPLVSALLLAKSALLAHQSSQLSGGSASTRAAFVPTMFPGDGVRTAGVDVQDGVTLIGSDDPYSDAMRPWLPYLLRSDGSKSKRTAEERGERQFLISMLKLHGAALGVSHRALIRELIKARRARLAQKIREVAEFKELGCPAPAWAGGSSDPLHTAPAKKSRPRAAGSWLRAAAARLRRCLRRFAGPQSSPGLRSSESEPNSDRAGEP